MSRRLVRLFLAFFRLLSPSVSYGPVAWEVCFSLLVSVFLVQSSLRCRACRFYFLPMPPPVVAHRQNVHRDCSASSERQDVFPSPDLLQPAGGMTKECYFFVFCSKKQHFVCFLLTDTFRYPCQLESFSTCFVTFDCRF